VADATSDRVPGGRGEDTLVRTFLLADVRGYTRYTAEHGDDAASALARRLSGLVGSTVPAFGGELLEVRGDETLCVFSSARQALRASVELQRRLRAPEDGEPFPLGVGMGLDAGEATPTDGGYRGAALNMAGRLVSAAGPGEVLATERLVRLSGQVDGLHWTRPRSMRLKGLADPELVVTIESDVPMPPPPVAAKEGGPRSHRTVLLGAAGLVLVVAVLSGVIVDARSGSPAAGPLVIHVRSDSVAAVDPRSGHVLADPHADLAGTAPHIAGGYGAVWTYGTVAENLYRVDAQDYHVDQYGIAITPNDIATAGGNVWLVDGWVGRLLWVDAGSPTVTWSRRQLATQGASMAATPTALWLADGNDAGAPPLLKLDPQSGHVLERLPDEGGNVAASGQYLWLNESTAVHEVLPQRSKTLFPLEGQFGIQAFLTAGFGYAWRAHGAKLWKISAAPTAAIDDTIPLPSSAYALATGGGLVWVATYDHILGIRPSDDRVVHNWRLSGPVSSLTYYDGRLWAARN
jgi:class 3 adenylate cyclase